jgi:hypothetical protein
MLINNYFYFNFIFILNIKPLQKWRFGRARPTIAGNRIKASVNAIVY